MHRCVLGGRDPVGCESIRAEAGEAGVSRGVRFLILPVLGGICGGFRLGRPVSLLILAVTIIALLLVDYAMMRREPVEKPE